tara:strand:- start:20445 stop:21353 length:909 start_codon:yes stop_codon:yes gene_type:complete
MSTQASAKIYDINYAQRERLAYIDFCLQFFGDIARGDLIQHFKTGLASCSRDFTLYKELAPQNLLLRHEDKRYYRTESFTPLFEHSSDVVLSSLTRGFGDGISTPISKEGICKNAVNLIRPPSDIIASIVRAITKGAALLADYVSLTSGPSSRVIVPHAIASSGKRWHVRAFDRSTGSFRDFVCTRFAALYPDESVVLPREMRESDEAWQQLVTLELVPHPTLKYPSAIELDFAMKPKHGAAVLELEVRSAMAGYLLRQWSVDCSIDFSLDSATHHLWLRNTKAVQEKSCLELAPSISASMD